MPRKSKKQPGGQRKGRGQASAASSELAISAGRGSHVPRLNLGRDTLLGIAQSQRRTLSFSAQQTLTSTAAAFTVQDYVLNNLFTPFTGSSASAAGFLKYMAFYSKAWVLGARIRVRGVVSATSLAPAIVGIVIVTNGTSVLSSENAIQNGMCDWMVSGVNPDRVTLSQAVDVGRFMNKPNILDDPQFYNVVNAGPSQLVVAQIFNQAVTSTQTAFTYVTEVEYDVVFTDPIIFT